MRKLFFLFFVSFLFVACTINTSIDPTENNTTTDNTSIDSTENNTTTDNHIILNDSTQDNLVVASDYSKNDGRLLVAQCAGCHGTNGYSTTSWDSIAGEGEFATDSFHGIMEAQTYAYSLDQKQAIDNYLNTLPENESEDKDEEEDDD